VRLVSDGYAINAIFVLKSRLVLRLGAWTRLACSYRYSLTSFLCCSVFYSPPFLLSQPLRQLTTHITDTYRICNPQFKYESTHNPRRVLTKPSKPAHNEGYDNEDYDYILYVNDWLGTEEGHKSVNVLLGLYITLNFTVLDT
jgi:hypothetical protein